MIKKIDLSKVVIEMIDGTQEDIDVSKELAQVVFQNTQSISEHSFALDLYKNPIVTLNDDNKNIIKSYTERFFKAFVKIAIFKLIGEEYENN